MPELRLGSIDGEYAFAALGNIAASPRSGQMFVAEASNRILTFDSTGKLINTFGRGGPGPGEFRTLGPIYMQDGNIVAYDNASDQISRFDESGAFLESLRLRVRQNAGWVLVSPAAPLGRDHHLGVARREQVYDNMLAYEVSLLRVSSDGEAKVVDSFVDKGRWYSVGSGRTLPIPTTGAEFAVHPAGDRLAVVHQPDPTHPDSAKFRIRMFGSEGNLLFARSYNYVPVELPGDYLSEFIAARSESLRRAGISVRQARRIIGPRMWRYFPPVREVTIGVDGSTWLKVRSTDESHGWWWVLDPQGTPVAAVAAPSNLSIRFVSGAEVWGVETDDLGLHYLVKYVVKKSSL